MEGNKMPAEQGVVISSGRPRVPSSSAVSCSGDRMLCDSTFFVFFRTVAVNSVGAATQIFSGG